MPFRLAIDRPDSSLDRPPDGSAPSNRGPDPEPIGSDGPDAPPSFDAGPMAPPGADSSNGPTGPPGSAGASAPPGQGEGPTAGATAPPMPVPRPVPGPEPTPAPGPTLGSPVNGGPIVVAPGRPAAPVPAEPVIRLPGSDEAADRDPGTGSPAVPPGPFDPVADRPSDDDPTGGETRPPQIDESFDDAQLDLATFTTPSRHLRVRDGSLELGVGARFSETSTRAESTIELEDFANFTAVNASLWLSQRLLIRDEGAWFSLRAHAYDTAVTSDGVRPGIHALIEVGDRGDGQRITVTLQQATWNGYRTLDTKTWPLEGATSANTSVDDEADAATGIAIALVDQHRVRFTVGRRSVTLAGPDWLRAVQTRVQASMNIDGPSGRSLAAEAHVSAWRLNGLSVPDPAHLSELAAGDALLGTDVGIIDGRAYLSASAPATGSRTAMLATRDIEIDRAQVDTRVSISAEVSAYRWLPGTGVNAIVLSGGLYNAAYDGNWNLAEADVVASVGLRDDGTGDLQGFALLERVLDADDTRRRTLLEHVFVAQPVQGTDYPVGMSLQNERVTLTFGTEHVDHTVADPIYAPWSTRATLSATASADGQLEGRADRLRLRR